MAGCLTSLRSAPRIKFNSQTNQIAGFEGNQNSTVLNLPVWQFLDFANPGGLPDRNQVRPCAEEDDAV